MTAGQPTRAPLAAPISPGCLPLEMAASSFEMRIRSSPRSPGTPWTPSPTLRQLGSPAGRAGLKSHAPRALTRPANTDADDLLNDDDDACAAGGTGGSWGGWGSPRVDVRNDDSADDSNVENSDVVSWSELGGGGWCGGWNRSCGFAVSGRVNGSGENEGGGIGLKSVWSGRATIEGTTGSASRIHPTDDCEMR